MSNIPWCHDHDEPFFGCEGCKAGQSSAEVSGRLTSHEKSKAQAIADGLNELGYGVDVPNEAGEMKFGPECHEVQTILQRLKKMR